jgi:hypothetical protein
MLFCVQRNVLKKFASCCCEERNPQSQAAVCLDVTVRPQESSFTFIFVFIDTTIYAAHIACDPHIRISVLLPSLAFAFVAVF